MNDGYEYRAVSSFIVDGGAHIPWDNGWEMVGGTLRRPITALNLTVQDALSPDNGKTKPLDVVIDEAIEAAVRRHGSILMAAEALGISRGTIWDRRRRRANDERAQREDPKGLSPKDASVMTEGQAPQSPHRTQDQNRGGEDV